MMNSALSRLLIAACVIVSPGCSRAEESIARREHILAADHGWIDLTVKAPLAPPAPSDGKDRSGCYIQYLFNGEQALAAAGDLAMAQANNNAIGYRFPAPAGELQTELTISTCVKEPVTVKLTLPLKKDHLAHVEFDGAKLVVQDMAPHEPTSLEWVRKQIVQLQAENGESSGAVTKLTNIALASLGLNFLALLLIMWKWRGRKANEA